MGGGVSSTLRLRGLTRSFGTPAEPVPVLRGLDLHVEPGSLVALLGPSGCGKTTALRLVAGFDRPDAGSVEIDGTVVAGPGVHVPPQQRRVGVVPQEGAVFPHLSVRANVGFGLDRRARRSGQVDAMLALVGLGDLGERMPHELSGGQLQRVALARALAPQPSVLLLDEPFTALDTALRASVREEVRRVVAAAGATTLLVTHDQEEALSMADEVAILVDGRVAQQGPPAQVYERPADPRVASFLGDAVWLAARGEGAGAATALGRLAVHEPVPRGSGCVLVRPEQVVLRPAGAGGVPGTVRSARFFGHDALVSVGVAGVEREVTARLLGAPVHLVPGSAVSVSVDGPVAFFADHDPGAAVAATMEE
jgi:iron(III) transport system ATP-binding protein